MGKIPVGGPKDPISIVGDKLPGKKAQRNEMIENSSQITNKILPHRNTLVTNFVCKPYHLLRGQEFFGFFLWITYWSKNPIRKPPLTCGQQGAMTCSEDNILHNGDNGQSNTEI